MTALGLIHPLAVRAVVDPHDAGRDTSAIRLVIVAALAVVQGQGVTGGLPLWRAAPLEGAKSGAATRIRVGVGPGWPAWSGSAARAGEFVRWGGRRWVAWAPATKMTD